MLFILLKWVIGAALPFAFRDPTSHMCDKNKLCCQESVKSPAASIFTSQSPIVSTLWCTDKQPLHE